MQKRESGVHSAFPLNGFCSELLAEVALQQALEGLAVAGLVRPLLSRLGHITAYTAPSVSKYTPAHTLPTKLCSANLILRQTHLAKYLPILTRL